MKDKRKNYVGKRSILTKIAMRRKSMNRKDKEIHQDRQRNKNNNKYFWRFNPLGNSLQKKKKNKG